MKSNTVSTHGQNVFKWYEEYGSILGFGSGLLATLIVTGPHFREWSIATSLSVIVGGSIVGGVVGHFAPLLAAGVIGGSPENPVPNNIADEHSTHHHDCGSDGDGHSVSSDCAND